jgi:hypothetical protein
MILKILMLVIIAQTGNARAVTNAIATKWDHYMLLLAAVS